MNLVGNGRHNLHTSALVRYPGAQSEESNALDEVPENVRLENVHILN